MSREESVLKHIEGRLRYLTEHADSIYTTIHYTFKNVDHLRLAFMNKPALAQYMLCPNRQYLKAKYLTTILRKYDSLETLGDSLAHMAVAGSAYDELEVCSKEMLTVTLQQLNSNTRWEELMRIYKFDELLVCWPPSESPLNYLKVNMEILFAAIFLDNNNDYNATLPIVNKLVRPLEYPPQLFGSCKQHVQLILQQHHKKIGEDVKYVDGGLTEDGKYLISITLEGAVVAIGTSTNKTTAEEAAAHQLMHGESFATYISDLEAVGRSITSASMPNEKRKELSDKIDYTTSLSRALNIVTPVLTDSMTKLELITVNNNKVHLCLVLRNRCVISAYVDITRREATKGAYKRLLWLMVNAVPVQDAHSHDKILCTDSVARMLEKHGGLCTTGVDEWEGMDASVLLALREIETAYT